MKKNAKIMVSFILVVVWMIVIFCFSATPADKSNSESMNIVNKVVEKFEAKSGMYTSLINGQASIETITKIEENKSTNQTDRNLNIENQNKKLTQQKQIEQTRKKRKLLDKLNLLLRKFAHASVYFILYILVLNLIYQIKGEYKFTYCMLSILVCFIYACTDEIHQLFVEGRTGLFSDVIIDTIGATISYIVVSIVHKIYSKIHKNNKNNKL